MVALIARAASFLLLVGLLSPVAIAQTGTAGYLLHYGEGNLPGTCNTSSDLVIVAASLKAPRFLDNCFHMRTGLNTLDTPMIDVLIVPPISATPERDVRIMQQAVEMWDGGIQYLSKQMGLDWLADGLHFNIFIDDGKVNTDPVWDPEIIVVATNPVGGVGIGIDPLGINGPCKGANPFAPMDAWKNLPGFNGHHGGASGTYIEPCPGGGTVCYAVNGAIDAPGAPLFNLFDLVAHEIGHCLTLGHVGDGDDHRANHVPSADIMAYMPQSHFKCVSTLDVEALAVTMSKFLRPELLVANHHNGPGGKFQIQHPSQHAYASTTGLAKDCPQADAGLLAGGKVNFNPGSNSSEPPGTPEIRITNPSEAQKIPRTTSFNVFGTIGYRIDESQPPSSQPTSMDAGPGAVPVVPLLAKTMGAGVGTPGIPILSQHAATVTRSGTILGPCAGCTDGDYSRSLTWLFYFPGGGWTTGGSPQNADGFWFNVSAFQGGTYSLEGKFREPLNIAFFASASAPTDLGVHGGAAITKTGFVPVGATWAFVWNRLDNTVANPLLGGVGEVAQLTMTSRVLVAKPGGPYSGYAGHDITLIGGFSGSFGQVSCHWTAPDATFTNPNACSTTVNFATPGDKSLILIVTDSMGSASGTTAVNVTSPPSPAYVEVIFGSAVARQELASSAGESSWQLTLDLTGLADGFYDLVASWYGVGGGLLARQTIWGFELVAVDSDQDGVADEDERCPGHDDLLDLDGDGIPDGCDEDRDGDGFRNSDELAAGTNPDDAASFPGSTWNGGGAKGGNATPGGHWGNGTGPGQDCSKWSSHPSGGPAMCRPT